MSFGSAISAKWNKFNERWKLTSTGEKWTVFGMLVAIMLGGVQVLAWLYPQSPDASTGQTSTGQTSTPPNPIKPSPQVQLAEFNGILQHPGGIAVDNVGTLYVTDHDGNRVLELAAGAPAATTMPQFNGVRWPSAVATDIHRNVYVADAGNNRVLKWTPGSTAAIPIAEFAGRLNEPRGVAVDVDSNIYVADSGSGQVLKLEASSGAIEKLPFTHLKTPAAVAVDDAESVYVADDNIPHVSKLTQTSQTDIFTYPLV
jgi:DNA-binding beta-propeller fold protein YncE